MCFVLTIRHRRTDVFSTSPIADSVPSTPTSLNSSGCTDHPLQNSQRAKIKETMRAAWDVIQCDIAKRVVLKDEFTMEQLKVVGGTDISFVKESNTAVACVVALSFPDMQLIDSEMLTVELEVPYISGYLAFREVNPLLEAMKRLQTRLPREQWPQCWVVDGNGVLHPRQAGLASHFGVLGDCCAVGVAKKLLHIDGLGDDLVASALESVPHGVPAPLCCGADRKPVGHVSLFGNACKNPVFISPGHRISFSLAAEVVRRCALSRVPEPTRVADRLSRRLIMRCFGR
eukprot:PhM_4_TR3747/c0_g1_i2/m.19099/K21813/ENDOV; endonuclease V